MRAPRVGYRTSLVVLILLIAAIGYDWSYRVQTAEPTPAFARKYDFACNVCHVPGFPKLNDFGNLFRDHGFQLGSDQDLPDYEGITMGYWPVSIRSTVGYRTQTIGPKGDQPGTNTTNGSGDVTNGSFGFRTLQFLSYGILARNISFGLQYAPELRSGNFGNDQAGGDLPEAFIRLNSLERFLGGPTENSYLLNLKVGKLAPELPFSAFRTPTQLNTPIVFYNYKAGSPYRSANFPRNTNISGGYRNATLQSLQRGRGGLELFGITPTDFTDGFFRYSLNAFSNNQNFPNNGGRGLFFYGHATQSFGGYGIVTGHRIGISGWAGDQATENNPLSNSTGTAGSGEPFWRIAGDLSLTYDGQWNLFGAFIHAEDSREMLIAGGNPVQNAQKAKWNGGFVELDWYPTSLPFFDSPNWLFTYRYDFIRNKQQGNNTFQGNYNNVDSHDFAIRYYFHFNSRTDIAWHTEYNWFRTRVTANNGSDVIGQLFFTGFDFSF